MTLRWISAMVVVVSLTGHGFCQGPQSLQAIDPLVERQDYNAALARLKQAKASDDEKRSWLRRQAEAGHVPMQYELAVVVFPTDREEALKWYARGRLARTLDAAECIADRNSLGARIMLDERAAEVRDAGVANPQQFQVAIRQALEWEATRQLRPSPGWICGGTGRADGGLKAQAARIEARSAALTRMQVDAKAVQDFDRAVKAGPGKYELRDSGIPADTLNFRGAGWLDNDRVLFIGDIRSRSEGIPEEWAVIVWNLRDNTKQTIASGPNLTRLCIDGTYVFFLSLQSPITKRGEAQAGDSKYWKSAPGATAPMEEWIYEGAFPSLIRRPLTRGSSAHLDRTLNCKPRPSTPEGIEVGAVDWLRPEHGYVVKPRGAATDHAWAVLHRPDGRRIPLPLIGREVQVRNYYTWKGAYLSLRGTREVGSRDVRERGDSRGDEVVFNWITPNGRVSELIVPPGVWLGGMGSPGVPMKNGFAIAGGSAQTDTLPGYSGLYLIEYSGVVRRLVAGTVRNGAGSLSPNGCRLGFAYAENESVAKSRQAGRPTNNKRESFMAVDVCKE